MYKDKKHQENLDWMLFRPQVKRKESTDKEFQSLDLDGKKLLTNKTFLTSINGDKKSSNLVE